MNQTADKQLEALLNRDADVKAAIRARKDKLKGDEEKDLDRRSRIIGRALLVYAAQFADFELMLRGVLKTTVKEGTSDHKYLKSKGWL